MTRKTDSAYAFSVLIVGWSKNSIWKTKSTNHMLHKSPDKSFSWVKEKMKSCKHAHRCYVLHFDSAPTDHTAILDQTAFSSSQNQAKTHSCHTCLCRSILFKYIHSGAQSWIPWISLELNSSLYKYVLLIISPYTLALRIWRGFDLLSHFSTVIITYVFQQSLCITDHIDLCTCMDSADTLQTHVQP